MGMEQISKSDRIRKIIYWVLQDGKEHLLKDIKEKCMQDTFLCEEDCQLVKVIIFNMKKKDSRIISEGRGKYRMVLETSLDGEVTERKDELESAIACIEDKMEMWQGINWLICSDDMLNSARGDFKKMTILAKKIIKYSNQKEW